MNNLDLQSLTIDQLFTKIFDEMVDREGEDLDQKPTGETERVIIIKADNIPKCYSRQDYTIEFVPETQEIKIHYRKGYFDEFKWNK